MAANFPKYRIRLYYPKGSNNSRAGKVTLIATLPSMTSLKTYVRKNQKGSVSPAMESSKHSRIYVQRVDKLKSGRLVTEHIQVPTGGS